MREKNFFFAKWSGLQLLSSNIPVNCLNVDLLSMIFFLVTLASCISPSLISSFLFTFRFPVIYFENFCLAVNLLGSWVMVTSVIPTLPQWRSRGDAGPGRYFQGGGTLAQKLIFERSLKVIVFRYYFKYNFYRFSIFMFRCSRPVG